MSEDSSEKRQREPDPEEVWGEVIKAQQEGRELTQDQLRALEIRKTALLVADAISQLIEDPTVQSDPVKEAELIAEYYEGILKLDKLGVKNEMHVGDKLDSFGNPTKAAEWIAGQIIGVGGESLPNIRQVLMQVREHSEERIDMEGTSGFSMPTKNMSPKLKNFVFLKSMVSMTHMFLASDLDQPQEPGMTGTSK